MAQPLYISECGRISGRTWLRVVGHGLTGADIPKTVTVVGAERSMNGTFNISRITAPDHIEYRQPGLYDIVGVLTGGAVGIN
jgi:hypothetical protein